MAGSLAMPIKPTFQDPLIVRLSETLNCLDPVRLGQLYELADEHCVSFEELAIENGLACERSIAQAYASHYLMPLFDPPVDKPTPIDMSVCKILPAQLCRDNLLAPLSDDGSTIEVAIFSPDSLLLADEIRLVTGRQMRPLFTTLSVVRRLLAEMYSDHQPPTRRHAKIPIPVVCSGTDWICGPSGRMTLAPEPASYFNELMERAVQQGASDIHIEPLQEGHRVRLRIDQTLKDYASPSPSWSHQIVEQLGELGRIHLADFRLPQEGSFQLQNTSRKIDVRINTCPTMDGLKTILRLVNRVNVPNDLVSLGMDDSARSQLVKAMGGGEGLILVTGPAGSGKSTTLAACLNELHSDRVNICTAEQNIDIRLPGVNQVPVRPELGLTYASAVLNLLRQDPDVLMVAEMHDDETASACFRAAAGGRLVLSSMFQPDAASCLNSLNGMGIKPSTIARTVRAVVSQRMVRRLCDQCRQPHPIEAELAKRFAIDANATVYRSVGCQHCRQTGYQGRFPIFEVVRITRRIAESIQKQESSSAIRRAAAADGVKLMRQTAIDRAIAGETSLKAALGIVAAR